MRKAFLAAIFCMALLLLALPTFAAEKVDNVFITGLHGGYYGATGWIGENYDPGVGFGLFFGYGITEYFSMQLDFLPMLMTSPSGDDVTDGILSPEQDTATWGGFSNGAFGGWGFSGRLYPRKVYREADFKVVQPYLSLGMTYINFIWEYKDTDPLTGNDYDGLTNILLDLGFGIDFHVTEFFALGPALGIHKPFIMGDTIQGETVDSDLQSDWEGSLLYNASIALKFQW